MESKFCEAFTRLGKKIGALGCLLSHFTIIQKAYANDYDNILIFEDDALFKKKDKSLPEILKKYDTFFDKIVKEYGIFYLGGNNSEFGMRKIIDNIYLTYGTYTTSSYIISKDCMKFVIDNLTGYPKEIDKFYQEIVQKKKYCFTIHPPIVVQRESHSDITDKQVNYDLNTLK
jgi:GR25 family glycosyltransferase involved in LPS biosynthesis